MHRHSRATYLVLTIAAGLALSPGTARAYRPGEPDPTFNGGQPVIVNLTRVNPGGTLFTGAAVDGQGRILVTGSTRDQNGNSALLLARFAPSGALDTSFGDGGSVVVQLGLATAPDRPQSLGWEIGPRPGGGWLVIGAASVGGNPNVGRSGTVTAFDDNGMIDIGFGTGGTVRANPSSTATPSASGGTVGPDGTAWVAGTVVVDQPVYDGRLSVSKVTPAGVLDPGFGNVSLGHYVNGFAEGTFQQTGASAAVVTPAGILVCGSTTDVNNASQLLLLRLTPTGMLDGGFAGGTGYVRRQVGDPVNQFPESQISTIAVGPGGEIYAAGRADDANNRFGMSVTRLTSAGAFDSTFGNQGTRRLQVSTDPGGISGINDIVVQPDGAPVVVGNVEGALAVMPKGVVIRFDLGGNLDPGFGSNGVVLLSYNPETFTSRAVLGPGARSMVVTGSTYPAGGAGHGLLTSILLTPLTTTTTLQPPAGCAAAPSLDGARCRLAELGTAIAAVPPGKLATRLATLVTQTDGRVAKAAAASGKALRKKLRKARKPLRALARQLASKAAETTIGPEQRADLTARTDALVSELQALAEAA